MQRIKQNYPTFFHFSNAHNPDIQIRALTNQRQFILNESAFIWELPLLYSREEAIDWIRTQYTPIFRMSDVDDSPHALSMVKELSEITFALFNHQKVSVLMLFIAKLRSGQYGKVYGTLRIDSILDAANRFLSKDLPKIQESVGAEAQADVEHEDLSREWEKWYYGYGDFDNEDEAIKAIRMVLNMSDYELQIHRLSDITLNMTNMYMQNIMVSLEKMHVLVRKKEDTAPRVYIDHNHRLVKIAEAS